VDFNRLSFALLGSRSLTYVSLKFGYSYQTHYYFIARCTLIAQVAAPMLSRVRWALLRLLACNSRDTGRTFIP